MEAGAGSGYLAGLRCRVPTAHVEGEQPLPSPALCVCEHVCAGLRVGAEHQRVVRVPGVVTSRQEGRTSLGFLRWSPS